VVTTPARDLVGHDWLALCREPFLQELDLRNVIRTLGEDVASTSPWRDDVEWQSETGTAVDVSEFTEWIYQPFSRSILRRAS
jgi:hypothetical protein